MSPERLTGTELATEGSRGGHGYSGSSDTGSACANWLGRGRAWGAAAQPTPEPVPPKRSPTHYLWAVLIARIYDSVPAAVPDLRWPDAPDRIYYRGHADQKDPLSHRGGLRATAHIKATIATAYIPGRLNGVAVAAQLDLELRPGNEE